LAAILLIACVRWRCVVWRLLSLVEAGSSSPPSPALGRRHHRVRWSPPSERRRLDPYAQLRPRRRQADLLPGACLAGGLAFVLLMIVMRGLLELAIADRAELDEVI
jgi:hypothetical protein